MTISTGEISAALPCHKCGYDLRAHPADGKCPECGASVAEALREAAIPRRPAWRDSDPRWRRRMLAGAWVLVLLPIMDFLMTFGLASSIPVPSVFDAVRTLDETFLHSVMVYKSSVFCIGVVLLFSKERGRRCAPLDWTRRWGVICSYTVALLSAANILVLPALVLAGIAAIFLSMPPKYQPQVTQLFVDLSYAWLRYGPYPKDISVVVLATFSSITILLACVSLYNALRSGGPKLLARILLIPLALFAALHIGQAGWYCLGLSGQSPTTLYYMGVYFRPELLARYIAAGSKVWGIPGILSISVSMGDFAVEALKWCMIFAIAVWLSIAQVSAWRHGKGGSS
jgi:hypothetical protein